MAAVVIDPVKSCQYKQPYPSARAAQAAKQERQRVAHRALWVYWCVECRHYHLTHAAMDWGRL